MHSHTKIKQSNANGIFQSHMSNAALEDEACNTIAYHIIILEAPPTLVKTSDSKCKIFNWTMWESITPTGVPCTEMNV